MSNLDDNSIAPRSTGKVDALVDENGSRIEVPEDSTIRATASAEQAIGATGPSNWWRLGLLLLAAVVVIIGLTQIFGGAPGTDTQPGSPSAEPVTQTQPVQPVQ